VSNRRCAHLNSTAVQRTTLRLVLTPPPVGNIIVIIIIATERRRGDGGGGNGGAVGGTDVRYIYIYIIRVCVFSYVRHTCSAASLTVVDQTFVFPPQ